MTMMYFAREECWHIVLATSMIGQRSRVNRGGIVAAGNYMHGLICLWWYVDTTTSCLVAAARVPPSSMPLADF